MYDHSVNKFGQLGASKSKGDTEQE